MANRFSFFFTLHLGIYLVELTIQTTNEYGLALVTIQAYSKDLHPTSRGKSSCVNGGIVVMFYASLGLLALGAGGVKGALPALGGNQFDQKDPKEGKALVRFFNWLLLSTTLGACVGVTGILWVSTEKHYWYWGFFISTVATFIDFVILALGKPFYRLREPTPADNPIIRIAQVIAAAINNRRLALPENTDELYEMCLDKAAIVPKDSKPTPWTACTVTQVEEVKILTRMLPILGSTIIMNTCMTQLQTFSIQQGNAMDRHLGKLEVPAASIPVIPLVFMSILIPIYEFLFVPFARKITHHPSGISQLQRVGVGLVLSAISMAVASIVEVKRRNHANKDITKPNNLNLFYWFLAILSCLNFVNYLYWASWCKYKTEGPDPDAKAKDLSTEQLLAKEESTLNGGATEKNEAPSYVQTEDPKQQFTSCW
ncbi:hypothetical protein CRYUN_Cryun08bG0000900 [Craigia yunnanensis]